MGSQQELETLILALRSWCERRGVSQSALSMKLGISVSHLNAILSGRSRPGAALIQKMSSFLIAQQKPLLPAVVFPITRPGEEHTDAQEGDDRRVMPPPPTSSRAPQTNRRAWDRLGMAISAAAILWAGLVLGAYVVTRNDGSSLLRAPGPSIPAAVHTVPVPPRDRAAVPQRAAALPPAPRTTAPSNDIERPWGSAARFEGEPGVLPRFRVVSGILARDVAEQRSKTLFEQGVDAFVRAADDNLAQIQYGAYRSKEIAEEDARHIRVQGYTAVVVRW